MENITVRLLDIAAVHANKTVMDLDILFTGTMEQCNNYCKVFCGYKFKADSSIHGGYYVNEENGDCLVLV